MDILYLKIFVIILTLLCIILTSLLIWKHGKNRKEKILIDFTGKFDDYTNVKKMAFVFVNEVKNLLKADFVTVIEYSQSKTELINSIPTRNISANAAAPNELYLILKNLEQNNISYIENDDIKSEYFKNIFPLFDYENYHICPIYRDNTKIITLEIYGDLGTDFASKKNLLRQLISIFQKVFIHQNEFQKEILKIKKNELIIKFLDRIRYTLDKDELEQIILEEICHAFNGDRAYFIRSDKNSLQTPKLGKEYLANPYVKSLKGNHLDFMSVWEQMKELEMNPPVFVIENSEKFLKQNKFEDTPIAKFVKESNIKSSYPFPVYEDGKMQLYLVLQFTKEPIQFSESDFEVMDLLMKQIKIALTQANLHTELILNSKKEKLLIDSISILRSSLDIKTVSNEFVGKVGVFFDADRCSIRFYDLKQKQFLGYDEAFEYKKHYYTPSTKNMDLQAELGEFLMQNEKFHDTFAIQYEPDLDDENFEFRDSIRKYADKHRIKSYLASFIRYNGKLLGLLSLHFQEKRILDKNDESFIKALSDQVGIAIYQSDLYSNIQSVAKKEKLLKEVYADTLRLQDKKQIYSYFSEKIMELFGCVGCVFVDFPVNSNDKIKYYENYKSASINISKFKNHMFFNDLINKRILNYNCKLTNENEEFNLFLKDTGVICIATIPVSENVSMVLFFNSKREFSYSDKKILFSLVDVISKSIKDSLKTAEIRNLKEGFLSTLSHDLQIPLVAERNAINYLINKHEISEDNIAKEILMQLKETNNQTEDMLKVLTSIYKYEAGKKDLSKEDCNFLHIIDESISQMPKSFFKKNITVKKEINTENTHFFADYTEMVKVILIIMMNINDSMEADSEIHIELSDNNNYLKCCISGFGENHGGNFNEEVLPVNIVTNTLEHRIGEGIYLYLAKLIISEHNGKIYVNNKTDGGKIFCIEVEKIN